MDKKEKILQMYFEEHQKQDIIAETVGVSQSYISKVVQKDTRYTNEKEIRHNESMQKKAEYNSFYQQNLKCQTLHLLNGIDQYINMIKVLAI